MRKSFLIFLLLLPAIIFAQQESGSAGQMAPQKYALVIGNSNYVGLTPLANPVNDANDIGAVLEHLGFTVDKVLNGTMNEMEDGVLRLRDRLSNAENAYGFFFYAGHGVQAGGENYLIPVDANIPNENYLKTRAVAVQNLLDDLNDSRNGLNVIVLDACRDNPFGWSRSGSRGLTIVSNQPADSIIVYATSAGQRASDGDGRNGLFTSQLISNLATPGIEISEVFRRTGQDVAKASGNQQVPAIYSQFFGRAFLGEVPLDFEGYLVTPPGTTVIINSGGGQREVQPSKLWSIGASAGTSFTEPWVVGTIRGTLAPFKYQFIEVGLNAGFVTTRANVTTYYSLTPYLHYAFYWPFNEIVSIYTGIGAGYKIGKYNFYGHDITIQAIPAHATAGVLLFGFLDVSYTFSYPVWTSTSTDNIFGRNLVNNLSNRIGNRFSVGYTYRFK